jgi:hypothetical protein
VEQHWVSHISSACLIHSAHYIVICSLLDFTIFFLHFLINGTNYGHKLLITNESFQQMHQIYPLLYYLHPTCFIRNLIEDARYRKPQPQQVIEHTSKIWVLIFCTKLCETFLILRINERDIIMNVHRSSFKVPVISVLFYRHFNFLNIFSKNIQITLMKIFQVGVEFSI